MRTTSFARPASVLTSLLLGALLLPPVAAAQTPVGAAAEVEALTRTWERYRDNVLRFVEVVPDSLLHFRPTEGVRNYAEQIEHVVLDNVVITATAVKGEPRPPSLGDKTLYLHDRQALRAYVDTTFAFVLDAIRALDAPALEERVPLFGEAEVTRAEALWIALEHGAWTLGQLVPYLRLNGITPPEYRLLP